jgi:nucleotide-binding universal stress UspA family protein
MYRNIMVPTDCSGFDREAIRVGLRVAARSEAKLTLVRVLTTGAYFGAGDTLRSRPSSVASIEKDRDNALTELYALAAECRRFADVDVTVAVESGPVADALVGYAKRHEIDLIVISSHGRGGFSRLSLGNVTDSLIRHTNIPVLVVKPAASYLNPQVRGAFKRIIVPLDGSALAEQILEPVMALAALEDSEIVLLNVIKRADEHPNADEQPRTPWWERDVAAGKAYLSRVAQEIGRCNIGISTEIIVGADIAEEIAAYTARQNADLVAMATHGRGGLSRTLRGSVADSFTRAARMSILVFRPSETNARRPLVADGELAHSV